MGKKLYKSQASSGRALYGNFEALDLRSGHNFFGSTPAFGAVASSPLSYVYEPPDLSSISEPNAVVALKNLQKKDSTTKSRALEDLQDYVSKLGVDKGGVEEEILEAWIKIYPRTSIDNARRVRQLAHSLQGQISATCGKRIAKHLPQLIGAWLAGLYDNDRSVARATQDSLKQVFTTDEKIKSLWRIYLNAILEYATSTIINETQNSISDERTTNPDDASAKYARVIGAAVLMVSSIIDESSTTELKKRETLIHEFLNQQKLWDLVTSPEPFVRRAVYKLAVVATMKQKDYLNREILSAAILTSSLSVNQIGSTLEYSKTLALLTADSPSLWTDYETGSGKKATARKLFHFLRKGSQGGVSEYWVQIAALIKHLPSSVLLHGSQEESNDSVEGSINTKFPILEGIRDGINNRDEPRANQIAAWNAYLDALDRISSSLSNQRDCDNLAETLIFPMVKQYVRPSLNESKWTISGLERQNTCVRAFRQILRVSKTASYESWHQLSHYMIEDFRTSLSDQSEDYKDSQDLISANVERWYNLQATVLTLEDSDSLELFASQIVSSELRAAFSVLRDKRGKPYSAAALVQNMITSLPQMAESHSEIKALLTDFANIDIPELFLSASAPHLIKTLSLLKEMVDTRPIFEAAIRILRNAQESSTKSIALRSLISSSFLTESAEAEALSTLVKENLKLALGGDESRWDFVLAAFDNPVAPTKLTDDLLQLMVDGLRTNDEILSSLRGLELLVIHNGQVVKDFSLSENGSNLLSTLLFLIESTDIDFSRRALELSASIEAIKSNNRDSSYALRSMIEIIRQGIAIANLSSLSVDSLVEQAEKLLNQTTGQEKGTLSADLLPSSAQWTKALSPFYTWMPSHSMSVMNPLGGALVLIDQTVQSDLKTKSIDRDSNGYSSVLRMAWYALKLVRTTRIFDIATEDQQILLYKSLALVAQFALHNLSVPGSNPLWENLHAESEPRILDFVSETQDFLKSWVQNEQSLKSEIIKTVRQQLFEESHGISAGSYYSGCAYSYLASDFIEVLESSGLSEEMKPLNSMLKSPDIFTAAAVLSSAPESRGLLRLCNELLVDLTTYDFENRKQEGNRKLVFLNCIINKQEDLITEIPQRRLVFFVKHMVSQLSKGISLDSIKTEIMIALSITTPPIKDIYDNFWSKIVDILTNLWTSQNQVQDDDIPILYASLRLFQTLKRLLSTETNDDLQDSWKEKKEPMIVGLLNLLKQLQRTCDETHDPRKVVNELLARLLKGFSQEPITNFVDLYPAVGSQSLILQISAYEILHNHIPKAQEQISLDKALEKDFVAKLPEELLSLILTAPSVNNLTGAIFKRTIPLALNSYLLSWKLIFDHWTGSSYKVKSDYAICLKDGNYLVQLLELIYEILIGSRSKPVNASQFPVETYSPDISESPDKELQSLLIHLYFLALKCLPNLSKAWWRDIATRQTAIAVEAWTEKYISPLIIASELRTISEWAPSQSTADQPLHIKVSPSAHELTASIPIDEQTMSIAIRLPPTYPLSRATVDSLHRVAVDEKKWRGWLITTQGVINFSDAASSGGEGGSLIDGLLAWRRNVTATLKGQTECAICYSVVAADRQLPTKRCGTCRNCFHGSCLFRWFKSSNSSSCPLCRNAFHYG